MFDRNDHPIPDDDSVAMRKMIEKNSLIFAQFCWDTQTVRVDMPGVEGEIDRYIFAFGTLIRMMRRSIARRYWAARIERRYAQAIAYQAEHRWWKWIMGMMDTISDSSGRYHALAAEIWDNEKGLADMRKLMSGMFRESENVSRNDTDHRMVESKSHGPRTLDGRWARVKRGTNLVVDHKNWLRAQADMPRPQWKLQDEVRGLLYELLIEESERLAHARETRMGLID